MDLDVIYNELDSQLGQINRRLIVIEEKLDESARRDHSHELKIQKLELAFENMKNEYTETKAAVRGMRETMKNDIDNLGEKIRTIESLPDKKKAGIVNAVLDRVFNYAIGVVLAAVAAYITIAFGKK
jgi:predicted  nucleic acid-binding Zn-ribbon protein